MIQFSALIFRVARVTSVDRYLVSLSVVDASKGVNAACGASFGRFHLLLVSVHEQNT